MDEPTADLSDAEADRVLELLAREEGRRALLFITHFQSHSRAVGGRSVLLADGRIVADAPTASFFASPDPGAAETYVRTGSLRLPTPGTPPKDLADDVPPPPSLSARGIASLHVGNRLGPRGFRWVEPGRLGGTPRPRLMDDLDRELELLRQIGIKVFVCLTSEDPPVPDDELSRHGIEGEHLPMDDMGVPTAEEARRLCRSIDACHDQGKPVALHCRGGLGRTGTLLAAYLIWKGRPALEALEQVRRAEPKYVQSQAQVDFLEKFDSFLRSQSPAPALTSTRN